MHEPLFARAARPAPAIVLGLLLRPFSIGHATLLHREDNPLAEGFESTPEQLAEAALICSQTWAESLKMPFDPLISLKLWLWRRRSTSKGAMHTKPATGCSRRSLSFPP